MNLTKIRRTNDQQHLICTFQNKSIVFVLISFQMIALLFFAFLVFASKFSFVPFYA